MSQRIIFEGKNCEDKNSDLIPSHQLRGMNEAVQGTSSAVLTARAAAERPRIRRGVQARGSVQLVTRGQARRKELLTQLSGA